MDLPPRQRQVLEFIEKHLGDHGYPPTLREIGQSLSIRSTNAVNDHLLALEKKGRIFRDRSRSRGIALAEARESGAARSSGAIEVPILGRIAAGAPLLAEENVEGRLRVDSLFVSGTGRLFSLRVVGDSMIEDGIFDGDLILVRVSSVATQGQTVVALVDGQATVKRFYRDPEGIRLQPANSSMEPIRISESDGRETLIQGVVLAVFRSL